MEVPDGCRCVGKAELFDSDDADDHEEAAALCAVCPALEWCKQHVRRVNAEAPYPGFGPSGTWAGAYFGHGRNKGQTRPKRKVAKCGTTGGYKRHMREGTPKCAECKAAQAKAARDLKARRRAAA